MESFLAYREIRNESSAAWQVRLQSNIAIRGRSEPELSQPVGDRGLELFSFMNQADPCAANETAIRSFDQLSQNDGWVS